jgi:transposase
MHLTAGCRSIFLYDEAVDMRKSFEGLSALVQAAFPGTLLTSSLFVFLNRRRNLIKVLFWDGDGFVIWYKRLEQGTFPDCFSGRRELTRQEYILLLEGVVPKRLNRRFSL